VIGVLEVREVLGVLEVREVLGVLSVPDTIRLRENHENAENP